MNVLDFADELYDQLKKQPALAAVTIKKFAEEPPTYEQVPFVNVLPRGKPRERVPLIGGQKLFVEKPALYVEVFHASANNLREAFKRADLAAHAVLDAIEGLDSSVFGVDDHDSSIDDDGYDYALYDSYYFFKVTIVVSARDDKSY